MRRNLISLNAAARLCSLEQLFHHLPNVLHIEAASMESAVRSYRAQHLADGLNPTVTGRLSFFNNESSRSHANDHSVTSTIERKGSILNHVVGCSYAAGQEARTKPSKEIVGRYIVGRYHDDATATSRTNPVFGDCHSLRGTRACRVDLCIRSSSADVLGKL
jgi:hypothetical protein